MDYIPTPRIAEHLKRLDTLTALRRPLTEGEQAEVLWLDLRIRCSKRDKTRYAADPEYREKRRRFSRTGWRKANWQEAAE